MKDSITSQSSRSCKKAKDVDGVTNKNTVIDSEQSEEDSQPKGRVKNEVEEEVKADYMKYAQRNIKQQKYTIAIEYLNKAIAQENSPDRHKLKIDWLLKLENYVEVLQLVDDLIKSPGISPKDILELIKYLVELGKKTLEILFIDSAIKHVTDAQESLYTRLTLNLQEYKYSLKISNLIKLKDKISKENELSKIENLKSRVMKIFRQHNSNLDASEKAKYQKMLDRFNILISKKKEDLHRAPLEESKTNVEPPSYFECPISFDLIKSPFTTNDNFTYEESEIKRYVTNYNKVSPFNGKEIESTSIYPNLALKKAIAAFEESKGLKSL